MPISETDLHLPVNDEVDFKMTYRFFQDTMEITKNLSNEEKTQIIFENLDIHVEGEEVIDFDGFIITTKEIGYADIFISNGDEEYEVKILVGPQATDFETNDAKEASLSEESKEWIKAVIHPYGGVGELTYEVENPEIAIVDNTGMIKPLAMGETNVIVTLTSQDGNNVVVKEVLIKVETVTVSDEVEHTSENDDINTAKSHYAQQ